MEKNYDISYSYFFLTLLMLVCSMNEIGRVPACPCQIYVFIYSTRLDLVKLKLLESATIES